MAQRSTIAVIIPVFNVERIIRPTLESVKWCDEIIVVDMFSTDKTKEICLSYPQCRFFERKDYIYGNVNFGIEQVQSDWILRLDSDEVVLPDLRRSIEKVLSNPNPPYDGYAVRSHLYFMGYPLRYGFGKDNWRNTFFKKDFAKYKGQSEHEELTTTGRWGRLEGFYDHFTNPTISAWVGKINYYTDRDTERLENPKEPTAFRIIYTVLRWFQRYYIYPYQGFRDGKPGFIVACLAAAGLLIHECKRWEKARRLKRHPQSIPPHPNA